MQEVNTQCKFTILASIIVYTYNTREKDQSKLVQKKKHNYVFSPNPSANSRKESTVIKETHGHLVHTLLQIPSCTHTHTTTPANQVAN